MAQAPKRRPGHSNPRPDADAPMRPVHEADLAGIHGRYGVGDLSIARGIFALLDWRKRRKKRTP